MPLPRGASFQRPLSWVRGQDPGRPGCWSRGAGWGLRTDGEACPVGAIRRQARWPWVKAWGWQGWAPNEGVGRGGETRAG